MKTTILYAVCILSLVSSLYSCQKIELPVTHIIICDSITFCASPNPQYLAVHGTDTVSLYIPNAFTPNGDGNNDFFTLFGQNIASMKCEIYDSSQKIYELDSLHQLWDGRTNNKINVKLYNLNVIATSTFGDHISFRGSVSLIAGPFLGDTSVRAHGNIFLNTINAQFPVQNTRERFDPFIPSGEAFITYHVRNCN